MLPEGSYPRRLALESRFLPSFRLISSHGREGNLCISPAQQSVFGWHFFVSYGLRCCVCLRTTWQPEQNTEMIQRNDTNNRRRSAPRYGSGAYPRKATWVSQIQERLAGEVVLAYLSSPADFSEASPQTVQKQRSFN